MSGLTIFEGNVCPLVRDDVDTDQIIPARFLKATTKEGIGEGLFADALGPVREDGVGPWRPVGSLGQLRG